ncbi:transporter substrate-binding domain-containing protein [Colwellia sp. BRX10-6]|uniref:substrate-binding periplasmic protein n=1 Tax=unclassified Colwellia TaxID=196834 RepID=UPI0015F61905|nr:MULTISPECIES: transporter substrate-binding domain-containing protein [unclassified Colwellia]MBA6365457.1 transporter substrate-binding domain-containing protein [Colwellia sp. BRX8-8]MBA6371575.1 transporter substrate-binding domain-containing protein [Colwellia sp. BRX8-4]MBA6382973.1 transporter substrate-binding domain-containing protein [Colwellia sp. BRX10-9]MBA6395496.1 transporter substrate-binding domain-containing protein [Colwellia sp. BRX10-6]
MNFQLIIPKMKRTVNVAIFLIAASMTLGSFVSSATETVASPLKYDLGSTKAWVPFGYSGNKQKPGIIIALIELIMMQAAIPTDTSYLPGKRAVTALELGQIDFDVVSPNWFKDKIIGVDYVSSVPLFEVTEYFVTLPNVAIEFNQPEMAYGQLVGTVAGYAYFDDDKFIRADFLSESELVKGLVKGRFKVAIIEERAAQYWAEKHQTSIALASLHTKGDIVIRLRKEHENLLPRINQAISVLKNNGQFKKVFDDY